VQCDERREQQGEEVSKGGFHGESRTPHHSGIHGLGLPKVVIILPCRPRFGN
jgi:hypothetical protein